MAQERRDVTGRVSDSEDLQRLMVGVIDDEVSTDWPEENWTRAREVHPGVAGAREGRKVVEGLIQFIDEAICGIRVVRGDIVPAGC